MSSWRQLFFSVLKVLFPSLSLFSVLTDVKIGGRGLCLPYNRFHQETAHIHRGPPNWNNLPAWL